MEYYCFRMIWLFRPFSSNVTIRFYRSGENNEDEDDGSSNNKYNKMELPRTKRNWNSIIPSVLGDGMKTDEERNWAQRKGARAGCGQVCLFVL